MSPFLFLCGRLWMAQLVPGNPVCKVLCKQVRKCLPQDLPPYHYEKTQKIKQREGRGSSKMNVVCIISNSPSATNTATEGNYDELFYICLELSIERKEKASPSKMNSYSC